MFMDNFDEVLLNVQTAFVAFLGPCQISFMNLSLVGKLLKARTRQQFLQKSSILDILYPAFTDFFEQ